MSGPEDPRRRLALRLGSLAVGVVAAAAWLLLPTGSWSIALFVVAVLALGSFASTFGPGRPPRDDPPGPARIEE